MKIKFSFLLTGLLGIFLLAFIFFSNRSTQDLRSRANTIKLPLVFVQVSTDWNAPWGKHRDVIKPYDQWGSWHNWIFQPEATYNGSSWRRKIASLIYPTPITNNFTSDLVTIDPNNINNAGSYPYIGPYDSSSEEIVRWQIRLAKSAGIDAFAVSIADTNTDDRILNGKAICPNASIPYQNSGLDRFKEFLTIAQQENFKIFAELWVPFYVSYPDYINNANICGSRASWIQAVSRVIKETSDNSIYLKINNKPVVSIGGFGDNSTLTQDLQQIETNTGNATYWLTRVDAGSPLLNNSKLDAIGVGGLPKPQTYIKNPDYQSQYNEIVLAKASGKKIAVRIYPGFDDAFRRLILTKDYKPMGMARIDGNGKNVFYMELTNAINAKADYLWIESWNDYSEQSTIEPARVIAGETRQDPYQDLHTLAKVLGKTFVAPPLPNLDKNQVDPLIYPLIYNPTITNAGITTSYNPWAVWVMGKNLSTNLKAQLFDGTTQWGGDIPITLSADKTWLSFSLPQNTAPSKCNEDKQCLISVLLKDGVNNITSNKINFILPSSTSPLAAIINNAGVNTSYQPWVVWVVGKNLSTDLKARLYDGETKWGGDITVTLASDLNSLSFQLPSNSPPSKCNQNASCQVVVDLYDSIHGVQSNRFVFTLPSIQ